MRQIVRRAGSSAGVKEAASPTDAFASGQAPAGAGASAPRDGDRAEAECVAEFAIGKQTGVRRDHRTAKWKRQSAVAIKSQDIAIRLARRFVVASASRSD
jgi:hypothetical protein